MEYFLRIVNFGNSIKFVDSISNIVEMNAKLLRDISKAL